MINIIHPKNVVTLYRASRKESVYEIWRNFKKLVLGRSMNFGTNISYNIEHACIIDNKYLLLRGWSFAKGSYTKTLISNCGFFLDKIPSMIKRVSLFETNNLIDHPNVGFMYYGPVSHAYDDYLKIELISDYDVVEVDVKLKHFKSLRSMIEFFPQEDMYWMSDILSSSTN